MRDQVRVRIDFAYDGTHFAGWATQPQLRTVQEELETGLTRILGRGAEHVRLTIAGRTDAGVHAAHTVAHADVPRAGWGQLPGRSDRAPEVAALTRLRGVLPADIVVRGVRVAPSGFDARFSALSRRYEYRLCDTPHLLNPLRRYDTAVTSRPMDEACLNQASELLVGLRDFAALCKQRPGATTIRTLQNFSWRREGGVLCATVQADAFCHSMVRALVGAVVPVGAGKKPVTWPRDVVDQGEKHPGVVVMPACGLTLMEVAYPPDEELALRASQTRAKRCAIPEEEAWG